MKFIKRILVFALALVLTFSLTACDSFEQRLKGFIEAMTFMANEPNLSSSAEITIRLSDGAVPVSFADFVAAATDLEALKKMEIGLAVESRIYGDSMAATLYWVGSNREEMLSLIYAGEDLYISTGILKTISPFIDLDIIGLKFRS